MGKADILDTEKLLTGEDDLTRGGGNASRVLGLFEATRGVRNREEAADKRASMIASVEVQKS